MTILYAIVFSLTFMCAYVIVQMVNCQKHMKALNREIHRENPECKNQQNTL